MVKETVFSVNTAPAVKNIGELRETIAALKKQLQDTDATFEENQQMVERLRAAQSALRNAMYATGDSMAHVLQTATGANVAFDDQNRLVKAETLSYNELVRAMDILKQQWRATTDASQRANLGAQINEINKQLKGLDASVGVFGRNVGNYIGAADHLVASFASMGRGAAGVIAPVRGATTALKAMSATPAVAVLGLLANVLVKVTEALKSSEEGMEGAADAMGALAGIGDVITAAMQGLAKGLGWVAQQTVNLLDKLGLMGDRMKANKEIAAEGIRIARQERDTVMKNAEAERDVAELRAKAAQKNIYTAAERIAFLEEAAGKEEEIAARAKKAAADEYALIVKKNAQTKSSAEALKAEADAYANMVRAETNYYNKTRELNAQIAEARKKEAAEAKAAARAGAEAVKARVAVERDLLRQEAALLAEGSAERLAKDEEVRRQEYEAAVADTQAKIGEKEAQSRALLLLEQTYQNDLARMRREYADEQARQALQAEANRVDALTKGTAEYYDAVVGLRRMEAEAVAQADGEALADYEARQIAAWNALRDAQAEQAEWRLEQQRQERENELAALEEGSTAYLAKAVEVRRWELDTLHQMEEESDADFRARQLAAEKAYYDAKKANAQAWLSTLSGLAGTTSSILGSIADAMESNTAMTEKQAKGVKALRIASATIDMLQGAVTAYAAAQELGVPMGPIVGKANAAAVIAAGLANIAKIRATQVSTAAAASPATASAATAVPAVVSAPVSAPEVAQVRTLTGASEEERLNRPSEVYILSSKLEADRRAVQARIRETTF